jgi:putative heme-binding domain-containing protein
VTIKLAFEEALDQMVALDVKPMRGDFQLPDARIIAPGDPYRSVLFYRMAKTGGGRMPHVGSREVDVPGLNVVEAWIRGLKAEPTGGADSVNAQAIPELLASSDGALRLARAIDLGQVDQNLRDQILKRARTIPQPEIRELFDRFLPASERLETLGSNFDPAVVLRRAGDPKRGEILFRENASIQCRNCHKVGDLGHEIGPAFALAAAKYDRAQLLQHLVKPSMSVEPRYQSYLLETKDGRVLTGILHERTADALTLRDARNELTRVATGDLEQLLPSPTSLMPEGLLSSLSAQQAADLLAFLQAQKTP